MSKKKPEQLPLPGMAQEGTGMLGYLDESIVIDLFTRGYWFNGFNAKHQGDGWFVVFKVQKPTEGKLVAFYGGKTLTKILKNFTHDMFADAVEWKADRYAGNQLTEED